MRRAAKVGFWILGVLGGLAFLLGLTLYLALNTAPGHDLALRMVLNQVQERIDGTVRVEGIRSDGLLHGALLEGVEVADPEGRPFLQVDSVRVQYSYRDLLRRDFVLVPVDVWGPEVTLERMHGQERTNVERIFRVGEEPTEEVGPPEPEEPHEVRLALRRLSVHDGRYEQRMAVKDEEGPDAPFRIEEDPDTGALFHVISFREVNGRLDEVSVLEPGRTGELIRVESLSFVGEVLQDPFRVDEFAGVVHRDEGAIVVAAERLHFPGTRTSGTLQWLTGDTAELDLELRLAALDLADFRWVDDRLPESSGSAELEIRGPLGALEIRARELQVEANGNRVRGALGLDLADELRFVDTELVLEPFHLAFLDPWLDEPLPANAEVAGEIAASGPLRALETQGDLTFLDLESDHGASRARFSGTLHLEEPLGVTDLALVADPFRYEWVGRFAPDVPLDGYGSVTLSATGRVGEGVRFAGELFHDPETGGQSRVRASGTVEDGEEVRFDVEGSMNPLSLATVARYQPDLPLEGELTGSVRVEGPMADLSVESVLETTGGPMALGARFDANDPGRRYRLTAEARDLQVSRLWTEMPEPTVLTGRVEVDGGGRELALFHGQARAEFEDSHVGGLDVDVADLEIFAEDGLARLERFFVGTSVGEASGEGSFALREEAPEGEMTVRWEAPSLAGLRPIVLGHEPIARDTLTLLEEEALRMQDVEPDTLQFQEEVDVEGRASGELFLQGGLQTFSAEGWLEVSEGQWGTHRISRIRSEFSTAGLPEAPWSVEGNLRAEGGLIADRAVDSLLLDLGYASDGAGRANLVLHPTPREEYRLGGTFQLDSVGGRAHVEDLSFRFDDVEWYMGEPTSVAWTPERFTLDPLGMESTGDTPMRVLAEGVVPLKEGEEAGFHLELSSLALSRLLTLAQSDADMEGLVDLVLDVGGTLEEPIMSGRVGLDGLDYEGMTLSDLDLSFGYRDRQISGQGEALFADRRPLSVSGSFPVDLSFQTVEDRFPEEAMELTVRADDVPAASVLGFLEGVDDMVGVLNAEVSVTGTPRDPRPSGSVTLRDGAFSLPELGLRPTGVMAELALAPDRTIQVRGEMRSRGSGQVQGSIRMEEIDDPTFDLQVRAAGFQAVDRRDVTARVGGEIQLDGRYTRPRVSGNVRVEQGTLFLEEFARTAEVVDLTDPAFFDVVDTTVVADQRVFVPPENPFLRNLRVDVDLDVARDLWLRGRNMNVEMGGELIATYDRPSREVILVGSLEPIRGSYSVVGRNFQVQEGTVEFVGTPGLNPSLDIRAVNRLRREGGEPLDIVASVEGTLESPRVRLTSEAQPPIAEADLISYLLFGRPGHALGAGETSILQGAAGAGVTMGLGTLATQLGTAVAQEVGLDYFAITQARVGPGMDSRGLAGTFAETQIEVGQYVGQDLFLALVLRPLTGLGPTGQNQVPGARAEWRFADQWMLEGVFEDRFSREGVGGFGELGVRFSKVAGLSIFREWGW